MAVASLAADAARKLFLQTPRTFSSARPRNFPPFRTFASIRPRRPNVHSPTVAATSGSGKSTAKTKNKPVPAKVDSKSLKRRTRSVKEFDEETALRFGGTNSHIPVMLGEVLEVFSSIPVRSFVDCTLGGAGHSCSMIQSHPEMQVYVGIDVDPVAHEKGQAQINSLLHDDDLGGPTSTLKAYTFVRNFSDIHHAINEIDSPLMARGLDGILMDLGMSSMQVNNAERGFSVLSDGPLDMRMNPKASLTAEDILNTWPEVEVGRILRDYGEESNWYTLQNKIVKARLTGGLHSTRQLVGLIQNTSSRTRGGRQGWIKTATRVFQALRIAVNDELNTLESSLKSCFNCLDHGGRLAVISFHSLEDRIVKQTFLNIIKNKDEPEEERCLDSREIGGNNKEDEKEEKEGWIKQRVRGMYGEILTKRPITPTEEEEMLNRRSRSAKLRVIQKF